MSLWLGCKERKKVILPSCITRNRPLRISHQSSTNFKKSDRLFSFYTSRSPNLNPSNKVHPHTFPLAPPHPAPIPHSSSPTPTTATSPFSHSKPHRQDSPLSALSALSLRSTPNLSLFILDVSTSSQDALSSILNSLKLKINLLTYQNFYLELLTLNSTPINIYNSRISLPSPRKFNFYKP